jgi:hypothetical protein
LRREKPRDTAPDGCDPAVFAAQCAEYLERAHAERELAASAEATRVEDAGADPIVEAAVAEPTAEEWSVQEPLVAESFAQSPVVQQAVTHEAIAQEAPVQPPVTRARAAKERAPRLPVRESAAIHTVSQAIASLSKMFDDQVEERHQEPAAHEQAPVEPELPAGMIELDLSTILEDAADRVAEDADEPEVYDLAMPAETDDGTVEAEFVAALAESEDPIRVEAGASASSDRETRSLWPTIEEAYAEARSVATRSDTVRPISARPTVGGDRGQRKQKPVQDEWGFFDPEQCGFAALIAKLDEIIENTDDAPPPRRPA